MIHRLVKPKPRVHQGEIYFCSGTIEKSVRLSEVDAHVTATLLGPSEPGKIISDKIIRQKRIEKCADKYENINNNRNGEVIAFLNSLSISISSFLYKFRIPIVMPINIQ